MTSLVLLIFLFVLITASSLVVAAPFLWLASHVFLLRRVYRTVDEWLGARRFENDHGALMRRYWAWLTGEHLAERLWPTQSAGGAAATPGVRRMRRYVTLELRPDRRWWRPARPRDVVGVSLRWTTEAKTWRTEWLEELEKRVAQALALEWHEHLFVRTVVHAVDRVVLKLDRDAADLRVPGALDVTDELAATPVRGRVPGGPGDEEDDA